MRTLSVLFLGFTVAVVTAKKLVNGAKTDSRVKCCLTRKTTNGKCCHFPFVYLRKTYHGCTTKNHNRPWCSLTANYDKDKKWGNCKGCSTRETTDGKCCVFPFIYLGKSYHGCTRKNHNRPWCSLTSNYDKDKKWRNCKACSSAETVKGKCCVFPFVYLRKTYHGCTTKNHNRPWCSLTSNYDKDRKWDNCKGCLTRKTTNGQCCHFPFVYLRKTYHGCTTKNHNRPWCSLTANYDKDKKWGNCKACSTAETLKGKCCVFPFTYLGKTYQRCTTKNHNRPWCSLTANYDKDKKWDNCKGCPTRKTTNGKCCHFPFVYIGKTYHGCTKKNHNRPWCSLTANYDKDKKWGNCKACSTAKTVKGKCCVFPFVYRGKTYQGCTLKSHNRPWCSLTANYDKDKKWDNCKGCFTRKTTNRKCCHFPFVYLGKTHHGCITKNHNRPWCSLTANYDKDKKWGNCQACSTAVTVKGKCCAFPFIYLGKTYYGCTTKNHNRPWCSLTANYDKDKKWDNCKACSTAETLKGKCCVFPFVYLGKTYHRCTTKNHNRPWCSLTANYDKDKKWDNCKGCPTIKTTNGKCCHFPFIYIGKTYHGCTKKNHNRPWCSLTANYDKDKKWGNCKACSTAKTVKGKCCVFPFVYLGKTYQGCTLKNHNRPWCSLTANYDKDKKWDNCKGCFTRKTTNRKCCHFPFVYLGKTYHGCITKNHNRLWCSLTANYDKDKKWGNCQACSTAETLRGKCCVFPFIYLGKTYRRCTTKNHNRPWCSLTANYDKDKKWDNCKGCPTRKTTNGKCCHFPFVYIGKTYHGCTKKNHNRPWCSLTANYEGKWGNCKDPTVTFKGDIQTFKRTEGRKIDSGYARVRA